MKVLVAYYSKTGNNKYLARKMAHAVEGDSEEIKPRLNNFLFLAIFSLLKVSMGIKPFKRTMNDYDRMIVCGPIWMGRLISPLRDVICRYAPSLKKLYFATCCGGGDAEKDGAFGYAKVFRHVASIAGDRCVRCEAFPIGLVLPGDKKGDDAATMNARLSDANFTGQIQERFDGFIRTVTEP